MPKKENRTPEWERKDCMSLSSPVQGVSKAKSLYLMDILKSIEVL